MSFANLPLGWVLGGLAGLAGALFVLQRLRVRHREVTVVTTLFWSAAVQEARARVLTDRFRHPLAYLLILLVASLVWIAAADPRLDRDDGRDHVLLLDGSAAMARASWFDTARARVLADAAWAPRERTTVVLCGATPRTVLLPGESVLLLAKRLEGATPEACPETVTRTLRELVLAAGHGPSPRIAVYGAADMDAARRAAQPDDLDVAWFPPESPAGPNDGVTGLGVSDAASGAWGAVDVMVATSGAAPTVTLDGATLTAAGTSRHADGMRLVFRDVPASGATITASLPAGDALAMDDSASRVLPARSPVVVAVPDDAPVALLAALRTDPAVRIAAADEPADVTVTRDAGITSPAIVLTDEDAQADAFVIVDPNAVDLTDALDHAFHDLALSQVDGTSLATTAGRAIRMSGAFGSAPQVRVWETLFTDRFDLIGQRAFPAFVARTVRRLDGVGGAIPHVVAVGEPLPADDAPLRDVSGAVVDPGDGELVPQVAGPHTTWSGATLDVALLDRAATAAHASGTSGDATALTAPPDLVAWAALLALALLCAEWVLFRRGSIP